MENLFVLIEDQLNISESCDCVVPCYTERYLPNLSFTYLSELNIERHVLQNAGEKDAVEADFLDSMETLHRAKHEIVTSDRKLMKKILGYASDIETTLFEAIQNLANYSNFSEAYDVIDILDVGYSDVIDDMNMFRGSIEDNAGILYDQRAIFVAHVQPGWRFLNSFSRVSDEVFPFYERFEECLGSGLFNDSSNTNVFSTAESPQSEDITGTLSETLDDLLPFVSISVDANGTSSYL